MSETVGRFAPSPSGRMHMGNLFSALIAWLSAKSAGGRMVLRIEDLDPERCKTEYAEAIAADLEWLGLDWDEGGVFEPYLQSRREDIYKEQFQHLEAMGLVYPCYCSRASLHAASAPHASDGRVIYSGTCRKMTQRQREEQTRKPAWRLVVPDETVAFHDGCLGDFSMNLAAGWGDFIIRRSDLVYAYQLAVVVDDALMGINQVVRGRDLSNSTPVQIYVNRLLGFQPPDYCHLPLLLAPDGHRLSKRERDMDVGELKKRFTAPELTGRLAYLGGLIDRPETVTPGELMDVFDWKKVAKTNITVPNDLFVL